MKIEDGWTIVLFTGAAAALTTMFFLVVDPDFVTEVYNTVVDFTVWFWGWI